MFRKSFMAAALMSLVMTMPTWAYTVGEVIPMQAEEEEVHYTGTRWIDVKGDQSEWKYIEDGVPVKNDWREIDGKWYYFRNEIMVTGPNLIHGKNELFNTDGTWVKTLQMAGKESTSEDGSAAAELQSASGQSAVVQPAAAQASSTGESKWVEEQGKWKYADKGHFVRSDWKELDGKWYYFDADGNMVNGYQEIAGKIELFNADGDWVRTYGPVPEVTEEDRALQEMAAGIVASITGAAMSDVEKANRIYDYIHSRMYYSPVDIMPNQYTPAQAAMYGFRRGYGNCYVYYGMAKFLLDAAGIPSIRMVRESDNHHFWNLCFVDGRWLHLDATPTSSHVRWCMVNTQFLKTHYWAHFVFTESNYPTVY